MNAATAKVEAAKTPNGPLNLLADASSMPAFCLLVPSVVLELYAALGSGRHCNVLAGVRTVPGTAAAVRQRSLPKHCAACMVTKVN